MKNLNLAKEYIIDKPVEELFSHLYSIVSSPFNNSKYTLFGNFVSVDPPEFIFMVKWWSIGRPKLAEAASTKLLASLIKEGEKSKITVRTKTNPALAVAFLITITILIIKLLTGLIEWEATKQLIPYLLIAVFLIVVDNFLKKMILKGFERDLKVKEG
jgi:hypothetical protein